MTTSSSSDAAGSRGGRARAWLLLKCAVSAGSLFLVARMVDWRQAFAVLRQLEPGLVAAALVIFWLAQLVSAQRSVFAARTLGGQLGFAAALRAHAAGLWFNQLLPSSLGGDVVKAAMLRAPLGIGMALRVVLLDRLSGLLFLLAATLLLLPLYAHLFAAAPIMTTGLGLLASGGLVGAVVAAWSGRRIALGLARSPRLAALAGVFGDMWAFRRWRDLWPQVLTSAVVHFNGIATYGLLAAALGVQADVVTFVLVAPLVFLAAMLPVSLAGWGVREAGAIWLFGMAGVAGTDALAISVAYGLFLIGASLPGLALTALRPPDHAGKDRAPAGVRR